MTCAVTACEKPAYGRGWCRSHYQRWWARGGDPGVDVVRVYDLPSGEKARAWKGDAVGYSAVHVRLTAERGRAATQQCADCGRPALHWAFDESTGFSTDLDRYRPLPCHRLADHRLREAS